MKSNLNSEVEQFLRTVTPAAKRSRLLPYQAEISKLREDGCSLKQICQFLSEHGVTVSPPGVWKFLKKNSAKESLPVTSISSSQRIITAVSPTEPISHESHPDMSRSENRKMIALTYVKTSSENPLFKFINKT